MGMQELGSYVKARVRLGTPQVYRLVYHMMQWLP